MCMTCVPGVGFGARSAVARRMPEKPSRPAVIAGDFLGSIAESFVDSLFGTDEDEVYVDYPEPARF